MDEFQTFLSKLHQFQQRTAKNLEFEKIVASCIGREEEESLKKKINGLDVRIENQLKVHKKANTDNRQLLRDLQAETEMKRTKKAAKERLISSLEEELAHLHMEQNSLMEAPKCEQTTKHLEEEEAMSIKQLGLEISKVKGGWLQFVFTQINVQRPNSKYFFFLKLDENRKYIVGDCQPEISDLDTLVGKLNSTNNLSIFVHSVRKRFRDHASQ